jgi:hypothetical protein
LLKLMTTLHRERVDALTFAARHCVSASCCAALLVLESPDMPIATPFWAPLPCRPTAIAPAAEAEAAEKAVRTAAQSRITVVPL